jgi:endonuclease/exonuclease/phosphatase (EEP) superfamily protein YafD
MLPVVLSYGAKNTSQKKWVNRVKRSLKQKGVLVTHISPFLTLCNAHLVANGDGDWSEGNRYTLAHEHDLSQLAYIISNLADQQQEILLTGDFNIPKCSFFYRRFVNMANVQDIFGNCDTPTFHKEFLPPNASAHCIDYMFLRSANVWSTRKTDLLFQEKVILANGTRTYVSDHLGLFAHLERTADRI